jgi:hemerythrin-like domain-containing protein
MEIIMDMNRRQWLTAVGGVGVGVFISNDRNADGAPSKEQATPLEDKKAGAANIEVTATEDLMREHGVMRRALFIFSESAARLRANPSSVDLHALQETATLFRTFGEDYHEKALEEAYIFPAISRAGRQSDDLTNILTAQHQRGRLITEYILQSTRGTNLEKGSPESLASVLESFVRMYRPHAAREDTVVFPAWKLTLTAEQYDQMNDKFEEIETRQLGQNGFENAVQQISKIEAALGLDDLARFNASVPEIGPTKPG